MRIAFFLLLALAAVPVPLISNQSAQAPAAVPRFQSDRIKVTVQGSGPDVLLIPGLASSPAIWRQTIAANPGYRYHLIHVNGFSGAKAGGNATGQVVEPVARDLIRYIADAGLKRPALIGHSMGGTLAMMVASRQPRLIGKLMVVDMLPQPAGLFGGEASRMAPLADSLRNVLTGTEQGRRLLGRIVNRYSEGDPSRESDPDVVGRAAHELSRIDLSPALPKIEAPMVVLFASPGPESAEHRRIVADYRSAYSGARTARLRPVAKSGHMIMHDQPARFHAEVKAFLSVSD